MTYEISIPFLLGKPVDHMFTFLGPGVYQPISLSITRDVRLFRPEFGGRRCDQCQENFWGDPRSECKPCNCNELGVDPDRTQCDHHTGECFCLEGTRLETWTRKLDGFDFIKALVALVSTTNRHFFKIPCIIIDSLKISIITTKKRKI